jgi:hypothetical protein
MKDQPGVTKTGLCRRSLLQSATFMAGAMVTAAAMPRRLFAQEKLAHDAVKYQDQPKGEQKCSTCIQFVPPSSCKAVQNPISPDGWCALYTPKPA